MDGIDELSHQGGLHEIVLHTAAARVAEIERPAPEKRRGEIGRQLEGLITALAQGFRAPGRSAF